MTLFARRIIQKIIEENSTFLTALQIENHVKRLNNSTDLSTEWEVVVLNVFSKFGTVIHEPRDLGPTHPDLLFYPFDARYCLLADITTVSGEGLDKRNPSFELMKELFRLRKQYKLPKYLSSRTVLSKGLGFDCVIIDMREQLSAQGFYVAMTRAMKKIYIISSSGDFQFSS